MDATRLRVRPRANQETVKEQIGGIADRRFRNLQKMLIKDLDGAAFRSLALGLYMRLGGWSHTGGSYVNAMAEVRGLCRELFGYEIPERIGAVRVKDCRYRSAAGLARIAPAISRFHEDQLKKA